MQPLLEVFGHRLDDQSEEATRHRRSRLCPFGNVSPNCTKDKAADPLGVCSIKTEGGSAIVCPVRFKQKGIVAENAARFFFGQDARWTVVPQMRLKDKYDRIAGIIDMVVVAYDADSRIVDFGAVEVQSVYISGNIRNPFEFYMANAHMSDGFDWSQQKLYPRPDYLSSSRKRLAPQLLYKGGILRAWGKRLAVALDKGFMQTLPAMTEVKEKEASIAWLVLDLKREIDQQLHLSLEQVRYTTFDSSMLELTETKAGPICEFESRLQRKLDSLISTRQRGRILE
jgi:hypothetical protein